MEAFSLQLCLLLAAAYPLSTTEACSALKISFKDSHWDGIFEALPAGDYNDGTGRASYTGRLNDPSQSSELLYLYHTILPDGTGRWIVSWEGKIKAFVNSWAVAPHLINAALDSTFSSSLSAWQSSGSDYWSIVSFECKDKDQTVYLDVTGYGWELSGFYVQMKDEVFSRIMVEEEPVRYLYRFDDKWMIGDKPGVDAVEAFVHEDAKYPSQIKASQQWLLSTAHRNDIDGVWLHITVNVLSGTPEEDLYTVLRHHRSLKDLPNEQPHVTLRNNVNMPSIGLGTGGIFMEKLHSVLTEAFLEGYRLLDLAREYGNEHIVRSVLEYEEHVHDHRIPARSEIFMMSKIWPTHLGYKPTTDEIAVSQAMLQSAYIDMHMLHWPKCNKRISWMHCETTVDETGTWQESWRALERAYSEGRLMSIGVSNFDAPLLIELGTIATVLPHAVQNHGEPGQMDAEVRAWCAKNRALYMPYASGRNIQHLNRPLHSAVMRIATSHNVSPNAVISRFFLQTGAIVIPRSSQREHLRENMQIAQWRVTDDEMKILGWEMEMERERGEVSDDEDL